MINLIGADIISCAKWLSQSNTTVHLYGKGRADPGRKMGHVTRPLPDASTKVRVRR